MTKEIRLIFDVKEITRLRFQCGNPECQQELVYRLDRNDCLKTSCPFCKAPWLMPRDPKQPEDARVALLRALQVFIRETGGPRPVIPKIEVEIGDNLLIKQE